MTTTSDEEEETMLDSEEEEEEEEEEEDSDRWSSRARLSHLKPGKRGQKFEQFESGT